MGKTSGFGRGVVEAIGVERMVTGNLGTLLYRDQTVVRFTENRSLPGDSGSVWLNDSSDRLNNYAAAVHFASPSDGSRSICYPVERAMRTYGTLVAIPAGTGRFKSGAVGGRAPRNHYAYVRPRTRKQLSLTPVFNVRRKK